MNHRPYRAGVIGLGVMGNIADGLGGRHPVWFKPCCHADVYEAHPRMELVAGSTRNDHRQGGFRDRHPGRPVYGDYKKMLEKENLDFVSIATPATCHAEMVAASAEAGVKGIYCEKAMAVSLQECDDMIAVCEKFGAKLAINHNRRWDDRFKALKRLLDEGAIGELQSIQVNMGGSRLCRGGSHMFDLTLMLSGDDVIGGSGWLSNPDDFDPGGVGLFETRRGIRVVVDGSIGMHHAFTMEVAGDRGLLRIVDGDFEIELWTTDEGSEFGQLARRHLPVNYPISNPMLNAVDDLIEAVERGGQPLSCGATARAAFEMIVTIHESHRQQRRFVERSDVDRDLIIPSN